MMQNPHIFHSQVYQEVPSNHPVDLQVQNQAYLSPRKTLANDIGVIQKMGVEIKIGVTFGKDMTFEDLKKEGYKAFPVSEVTISVLRVLAFSNPAYLILNLHKFR